MAGSLPAASGAAKAAIAPPQSSGIVKAARTALRTEAAAFPKADPFGKADPFRRILCVPRLCSGNPSTITRAYRLVGRRERLPTGAGAARYMPNRRAVVGHCRVRAAAAVRGD